MLRTSIDKIRENGFELTKKRSRRYPAKTITDADYADNIALLANTPNQAETLLHSLERAAAGIGLHLNAHKTEYMCYNQTGDITTRDGASLKLVDKFTYLGSSVSSTEKDIDTRLMKAWTAIDRLSIIWKSDLTDKMKRSFFQAAVVSMLLYGCTTWIRTKRLEKKLGGNYIRMLRAILNLPGVNTPQDTKYAASCLPSRKLYKLDEPDTQDTAEEARTNSSVMYSNGPTHIAKQKQDDQHVGIRDVTLKTCQKRWMIGRSGERGSGISVPVARLDDDDDDDCTTGQTTKESLINKDISYPSTATIVCSRNTDKESSHISFFCGGVPFCEVVRRPVNTHKELTDLLEWLVGLSLRLRDQQISLLRLSDQRISTFSPKLQTLYCLFKSHAEVWTSSSPHVFFCSWLVIGTYILLFFPGNLLILSANRNICHSIHRQ